MVLQERPNRFAAGFLNVATSSGSNTLNKCAKLQAGCKRLASIISLQLRTCKSKNSVCKRIYTYIDL